MEYPIFQNFILPLVEALIRGFCFYYLVKPFLFSQTASFQTYVSSNKNISPAKKKTYTACIIAVYFGIILLFYIASSIKNTYTIYSICSLVMFFLICIIDRRNYRQKLFLTVTFFSLSWLSATMSEILYDNFYAFAEDTNYMNAHPDSWFALFVGVCIFYLCLEFLFTALGIRQILKVYKNKSADMNAKELIMLSIPSLIGIIAYQILPNYRMFYIVGGGKDKNTYEILMMLFYAALIIAIVVVIVLYQDIKAKQEENQQTELLAMQIGSLRRHIEQVESLYQNIHSVRHDMTNHLLTLERLYEGNHLEQAKTYSESLKTELAKMTGGIESGNPVTDVILLEFQKEAAKRKILFHSEFCYPTDFNINVFDISIILNNALQNAVESTEKEIVKQILIESYRRNNAYIIEIRNSFTGALQWNAESGLPVTSKEKTDGHGYGLSNIRRIAGKYAGDIDIALDDGEFFLCIMLMLEA